MIATPITFVPHHPAVVVVGVVARRVSAVK
jgi:hypothetical protein